MAQPLQFIIIPFMSHLRWCWCRNATARRRPLGTTDYEYAREVKPVTPPAHSPVIDQSAGISRSRREVTMSAAYRHARTVLVPDAGSIHDVHDRQHHRYLSQHADYGRERGT